MGYNSPTSTQAEVVARLLIRPGSVGTEYLQPLSLPGQLEEGYPTTNDHLGTTPLQLQSRIEVRNIARTRERSGLINIGDRQRLSLELRHVFIRTSFSIGGETKKDTGAHKHYTLRVEIQVQGASA